MIETIKTKIETIKTKFRRMIAAATCHHSLYGQLAALHAAEMAHVVSPETGAVVSVAVYLALAMRG